MFNVQIEMLCDSSTFYQIKRLTDFDLNQTEHHPTVKSRRFHCGGECTVQLFQRLIKFKGYFNFTFVQKFR